MRNTRPNQKAFTYLMREIHPVALPIESRLEEGASHGGSRCWAQICKWREGLGSAGQPWPSSMPASSRSEAALNRSCSGKLAGLEALLCASKGALGAVNRLGVCSKTEKCVSWTSNGAVVNVCLLSQTYRQASMLALVHG